MAITIKWLMLAPASDFDDNNSIIFTLISMGADEPALSPHCPRRPVSHTSHHVMCHVARASCFGLPSRELLFTSSRIKYEMCIIIKNMILLGTVFGSDRSLRNANVHSSVCLSGEKCSRAHNLHLLASGSS